MGDPGCGLLLQRGKRLYVRYLFAFALLFSFTFAAVVALLRLPSALTVREVPIQLRVRLEGFPRQSTVHVNVYELRETGTVRVASALARDGALPEVLTLSLATPSSLNVFAYAYDREGVLYAASAYVAVYPEVHEYAANLAARKMSSSRVVSGRDVPAPRSYSHFLDRHAESISLAACSAPPGASCYIGMRGVELLVQAFEKVYWTLDPTLQTWNEGDWTPAGYVWYKIDFDDVKYSWSNGSLHIFPTNVDYVIATVSEGKAPPSNETGPYIVRVLLYAKT